MIVWRACAPLVLALAAVCPAVAQAPAGEASIYTGVELGRQIEAARSQQKRSELTALVSDLPLTEQRALVGWASERTWWFLSEALARVGSDQAAGMLAKAALDRPVDEGAPNARHLLHRSAAALEALGAICPPQPAVLALVDGYLEGDRRQRGLHRRAILRVLSRRGQGLRALDFVPWPSPAPGWLESDLASLCTEAFRTSDARMDLLGQAALASSHWVHLGTVQGIGARAREARQLIAAGKLEADQFGLQEVSAYEAELANWWDGSAPDPIEDPESDEEVRKLELRVAICEALPFVLDGLDDPWAQVLIAELDPEASDRPHRDAAWRALKRISGQTLPQSVKAWRSWWEAEEAGAEQDDDEAAE